MYNLVSSITHSLERPFSGIPFSIVAVFASLFNSSFASPSPTDPPRCFQWEEHLPSLFLPQISLPLSRILLIYLAPFVFVFLTCKVLKERRMRKSARLNKRKDKLTLKEDKAELLLKTLQGDVNYYGDEKKPRIVDLEEEDKEKGSTAEENRAERPKTTPLPAPGRKKLERIRSSPSLPRWSGSIGYGLGHRRRISSPSLVSTIPPNFPFMPIVPTEEKETHEFGQNPDYSVVDECAMTKSSSSVQARSSSGSSLPSPLKFSRLASITNRDTRSNSHYSSAENLHNNQRDFVSTSLFPFPTLRPEGSQPSSPSPSQPNFSISSYSTIPNSQLAPPQQSSRTRTAGDDSVGSSSRYFFVDRAGGSRDGECEEQGESDVKLLPYWAYHYPKQGQQTQMPQQAQLQVYQGHGHGYGHGYDRIQTLLPTTASSPVDYAAGDCDGLNLNGGIDVPLDGIGGEKQEQLQLTEQKGREPDDVIIFEQGQSMDVTGESWKWRRKVRIFKSEALSRLEREGLVRF